MRMRMGERDKQTGFLVGSTYLLLLYGLWFAWHIISPADPYQRMIALVLGIGHYALLQYMILKAIEAVGDSEKLNTRIDLMRKGGRL
jgi:hypothetical protein